MQQLDEPFSDNDIFFSTLRAKEFFSFYGLYFFP